MRLTFLRPRRAAGNVPPALRCVLALALLASPACDGESGRTPDPGPLHNVSSVPQFTVSTEAGRLFMVADAGVMGIGALVGITVREPITVVRVEPWHTDEGAEVLAVRAAFYGRASISPSGHRMLRGVPLILCLRESDLTGHGGSYPVEGLQLEPGDPVEFLFYVRVPKPAAVRVTGYRITFRDRQGTEKTVTGDRTKLDMDVRAGRQPGDTEHRCNPESGRTWGGPLPGFP